jgi:hypothetical protein
MGTRIAKKSTIGVTAVGREFDSMAAQLGYHERQYLQMNASWARITKRLGALALGLAGVTLLEAAAVAVLLLRAW